MYNRLFKLWYYPVSHGQMLLRSIGNEETCNMDIYFGAVSYIELPVKINNIIILEPQQEDIDYIVKRIGNTEKIITVLLSNNHKLYVVFSIVKTIENDLGMFDLPFDIPDYNAHG